MGKPVFDDLFTASGRRNRKSYILYSLALTALMGVAALIGFGIFAPASKSHDGISGGGMVVLILFGIALVIMAISSWMVGAQRCRDFGWTGWAILLTAIPYLGIVFAFALWFIPGNQGENRYGSDPLV